MSQSDERCEENSRSDAQQELTNSERRDARPTHFPFGAANFGASFSGAPVAMPNDESHNQAKMIEES